jgi:hypothetical protein
MNERDPLDALVELVEPFDNDPNGWTTCCAAPTPSAQQAVRREVEAVMGQTG